MLAEFNDAVGEPIHCKYKYNKKDFLIFYLINSLYETNNFLEKNNFYSPWKIKLIPVVQLPPVFIVFLIIINP